MNETKRKNADEGSVTKKFSVDDNKNKIIFSEGEQVVTAKMVEAISKIEEDQILKIDVLLRLIENGLHNIVEDILSILDIKSLLCTTVVSKKWYRIVSNSRHWKKLTLKKIRTNPLWHDLVESRGWMKYFNISVSNDLPNPELYKKLHCAIIRDEINFKKNWKGGCYNFQFIPCQSVGEFYKVLCIQHDNCKMVCGMEDGIINVWELITKPKCIRVFRGHTDAVLCLQYNSEILISGSNDHTVRIWDVQNGVTLNVLEFHQNSVNGLRFNDKLLVTCSNDQTIAVWNMTSPLNVEIKNVLELHFAEVERVEFDDQFIISVDSNKVIKVWFTSNGKFSHNLANQGTVTSIYYNKGILITGSANNLICIWNVENKICTKKLGTCFSNFVTCIDDYLISAASNGNMKVCEMNVFDFPPYESTNLVRKGIHYIYAGELHKNSTITCMSVKRFSVINSYVDGMIEIMDFLNHCRPPLDESLIKMIS